MKQEKSKRSHGFWTHLFQFQSESVAMKMTMVDRDRAWSTVIDRSWPRAAIDQRSAAGVA